MWFTGAIVRQSASELTVAGRPRFGSIAIMAGLCVALALAPLPTAKYFEVAAPAVLLLGVLYVVVRSRTRLVFQPNGFVLAGYEGLRRYRVTGRLADLDIVGVSAMLPHLEGMPYKDPDFFLQLVVAGRTYRAFRGLERSELEEISARLLEWKTRYAV